MGMKRILLLQVLIILLLLGCSQDVIITDPYEDDSLRDSIANTEVVYGINILKNGGLNSWHDLPNCQYDVPTDWSPHNNQNVKRDHKKVYEGSCSARMNSIRAGSTARIDQEIPVTPGSKIRICFRYYVERWEENGARTYCYFRTSDVNTTNISASELREFFSDNEYSIIRGGGYGKKYLPHSLNVWLTFDETITVPPTAHCFDFGINSYYGTTIYVDDCYVGEVVQQ